MKDTLYPRHPQVGLIYLGGEDPLDRCEVIAVYDVCSMCDNIEYRSRPTPYILAQFGTLVSSITSQTSPLP